VTTGDRRRAVGAALPAGTDAALVTNLTNVRYLTGFTGSNAALAVSRDGEAVLATDGRYDEQARAEVPDVALQITRTPAADLLRTLAASARGVAIDRRHVTLAMLDDLAAAAGHVELIRTDGLVETLRMSKDDDEIAALREACQITDAAFTDVLAELRPGKTEREISWRLLESMRRCGAEDAAFDSIVAFGPNSAIPHHRPTDRQLEHGDLVKLDFGALVRGYHADMTRTVVCGRPSAWQQDLHAQVLSVQERCRDAVTPGVAPVALDELARRLIDEVGPTLVHGLGHGVGLEIHERPFLVPNGDAAPLQTGMCVTIEPGIYLPGQGGVRIEDTVVVGSTGAEPLTQSSRELVAV